MADKNGFSWVVIVTPLAVLAMLMLAGFLAWINPSTEFFPQLQPEPVPIACTQEAMQCPDGSYVARTGSNCEFATCPNLEISN